MRQVTLQLLLYNLFVAALIFTPTGTAMATVCSASEASSLPALEFLLLIRTEAFSSVYSL